MQVEPRFGSDDGVFAMQGHVRSVVSIVTVCFAVSLVALCLVIAANAVTQSLAPAPLAREIRKAFMSGALPEKTTQDLDRQRGALLYNDCLILGMALNRDPGLAVRIVSPALFESPSNEEINKDTCAILHDVVVNRNAGDYRGLPYHRYVSAFVPVVAALVTEKGVTRVKHTLLLLNYAALFGLAVAGLAQCTRAMRRREPVPFYMIVFPLGIVVFGGVEFFGQNLSIGIADLGLYALIAILFYTRPETWPPPALAIIASVVGAFIGSFEFFTGQIPVMLALPVALLAMKAHDDGSLRKAIASGLMFAVCAALGTAFLFMQKIALAIAVAGPDVFSSFTNQLAVRVGDASYGIGNMVLYMAGRADRIGQGSLVLGLANAFFATLAGTSGLVWLGRRGGFPFRRALAIAASMMAIVVWHIVFRNHSTIHSEFMVRSTSFVFASAWIVGGFALASWSAERSGNSGAALSSAIGRPSSPR